MEAGCFAIAGTVLTTRAALSRRPASVSRLESWRESAATWTASRTLPAPIRIRLTR
ncbi:MAG: hypothetical protein ACRDRD_04005 [Pseudonocardiaceae bacterium]